MEMNMSAVLGSEGKGKRAGLLIRILAAIAVMAAVLLCAMPAKAATMKTGAKPKFVLKNCRFTQESVTLTWKKVKGAKKYVVYRAKKKNGKYKKFAKTKKLTVTKKSPGDYYYKVQAVSGSRKSQMSAPVHLFAAFGNIYNSRTMSTTIYIGGYGIPGNSTTWYYCALKNLSKKTITIKEGDTCQFIQLNPETREIKELGTGTLTEGATIKTGTDAQFTVKAKRQTVESGTVLVIQIPFKAGSQKFTLNIARKPENTWISAAKK